MEYHKEYTKINEKTIKAVRKTIKKGLFKCNDNVRFCLLKELLKELEAVYNVQFKIKLLIEDNTDGYYNPHTKTIVLNSKLSLITLLHEFKHALQHLNNRTNSENIARGWSLSVYYKATPRLFERAVNKGLIIHQRELIK